MNDIKAKRKSIAENTIKVCSRCIYDETIPAIKFDENGVCNYCHMMDGMQEMFKTGTHEGEQKFLKIIEDIKKAGKGKKYDCVIGVSGGTDSSFLVYKMVKEWGLRPLAVHYDNTWNSAIATENIRKVLGALKVDLYTHVVNNSEMDEIYRAFFVADVPELDACTDLGFVEVMYRACAKYKIKYLFEGHSYKTEGISPLSQTYFDGGYIKDIVKKFSGIKFKTYPLMDFISFLKWIVIYRIKRIRPLWYISYSKEEARSFLMKEFGWEYYGGHHLENRMAAFCHSYFFPRKFNLDQRNNSLSAAVRSGFITRETALAEYTQEPYLENEILSYFKKRLKLSDDDFETIMNRTPRHYTEFKTYKKRFELLRPLFFVFAKLNLVPMSFYAKYCFKKETK